LINRLVKSKINQMVDAAVAKRLGGIDDLINERVARALSQRTFWPLLPSMNHDAALPFMPYSSCSAADMLHPRYSELSSLLHHPPVFHRKLWEWIFVMHHLLEAGVIDSGKRGICFGVGSEALPALFAARGSAIMATDAPPSISESSGWVESGQHAASRESLRQPNICPNDRFDELVTYRYCDMNDIDSDLAGYDFAWSSCCFEHLGSIEAGMQFVINCVDRCLKPGGVAVHTTELNLSSDEDTLTSGGTVLYRRRDIIELVRRLTESGHDVQPFNQAPDEHVLDFHVDVPPYTHDPHLKLNLSGYVTTSVGIVVRRGRA
jgi:SAM-dependent methyltransferase